MSGGPPPPGPGPSAAPQAAGGPGQLADPFGLVGTVLEGQYRADAVVGEGGFGVVYRARHLSLDQPIAIKVLKGLDGGDPTINALVLEKFRAEARLLYTLSQSSLNIVRALDFGATTMPSGAWAPFMILEWLEGRSLADDLLERRRQGHRGRSLAEALTLLQPVAEGLGVAHKRHVAHRDVKPANVFLLANPSSGPAVKVLDFGIAKIMKDGESAGTKGTFASFTWLYATPEQLDPRVGTTGLATDVYAFALLLTELLTDRAPIDDRDVVGIMRTALHPTRRPTPRTRGANVPDDVEAICQRALSVDPKARYASIAELWAALAARDQRLATAMQQAAPSSVSSTAAAPPPSFILDAQSPPSPRGAVKFGTTTLPLSRPAPRTPAAGTTGPQTPVKLPPQAAAPPPSRLPTPSPIQSPFQPHGYGPPPAPNTPQPMTAMPMSAMPMTAMPMTHNPMSPPPGTAPPGRPPPAYIRTEATSPIVWVTIVFFILAVFLAGTCAVVHSVIDS